MTPGLLNRIRIPQLNNTHFVLVILSNARALPISAGTALAIGVLKEVSDSRRAAFPLFSLRDLAADALGVAAAALVTRL